jgi:hypothetical protein
VDKLEIHTARSGEGNRHLRLKIVKSKFPRRRNPVRYRASSNVSERLAIARKHLLQDSWLSARLLFYSQNRVLAALATRNLTTVLAGILIFCCVFGLKPERAFLFCFKSLPKPGKTNSPLFLISLYARSLRVSRNTAAVLLFVSVAAASETRSSVLVMSSNCLWHRSCTISRL